MLCWDDPAAHALQAPDPAVAYWPEEQVRQPAEPAAAASPDGQATQLDAPRDA